MRTGQERTGLTFLNSVSLFLISAVVIFLQIVLLRSLSITRYHHFSYLVISVALLGFGASGTFLAFFNDYLKKHFIVSSPPLIALFGISIPLSYVLAELLPIDIQFILFSREQVLLFLLCNLFLFIPFFFAGIIIGLALSFFQQQVPVVYGINLFGSGAGGVIAMALLSFFSPFTLIQWTSAAVFIALILWILSPSTISLRERVLKTWSFVAISFALSIFFPFFRLPVNIDQYKMISHMERLRSQSEAKKILTKQSPRAEIDVYSSEQLHQALFAGLNADVLPPRQMAVLIDGNYGGTIFRVDSAGEAGILDFTPQSIAYRMVDSPRVLLLGETGGVDVWLAKRFNASRITVVQGNRQLNAMMLRDLRELSGSVYAMPDVEVITEEPHLFVQGTKETFDIIHMVAAEGMSAGVSGLQSLHEDYLLTVETVARCYERLSNRGFVTITRGIQAPPRDNLRIFALFATALESLGIEDRENYLLQARNYLAANTMISKEPVHTSMLLKYLSLAQDLMMDPEYYPGVRSGEGVQINKMEGPPGASSSYLHYGAMKILSADRDDFFRTWMYRIDPPTNDRPYFYDFFRWHSLGRFIDVYGRQWLQRLELGYAVLVITLAGITVTALVLILIPLFVLKRRGQTAGGLFPVVLYFLSIGFGFMFIEMVFIQKSILYLGDPIHAVTVVLTSILIFAGMGSLLQGRMSASLTKRMRIASVLIVLILACYIIFINPLLDVFISSGMFNRFLLAGLLLAPLSFFMGWMFPNGLACLGEGRAHLIPWAWGVNGFASVAAAPLAVLLSMSFGFSRVILAAGVLYMVAGIAGRHLEKKG